MSRIVRLLAFLVYGIQRFVTRTVPWWVARLFAHRRHSLRLVRYAGFAAVAYIAWPIRFVPPGSGAVRFSRLGGSPVVMAEGPVFAVPALHELRLFPLREQIYTPNQDVKTFGFQSLEGLRIGVEVTVRYALEPAALPTLARRWPEDLDAALIRPTIDSKLHGILAAHTVRDIYTAKRAEIQAELEAALKGALVEEGVHVRSVAFGRIDLPDDYRVGLEALLKESLSAERMQYTIVLKAKQIEERALEGEAAKVAREKAAEASAAEQIIAAKGQAEAMRHVLPFKEREIEQRRLEAEAVKIRRVKEAEGEADAHRIEATGEADARKLIAAADAFRIEITGEAASKQLARESTLIAQNPLLIQKAFADKLSDKIQVIVAPPQAGGFFAGGLIGEQRTVTAAAKKELPPPPAVAVAQEEE